ncbi:PLP-dependent aminotransferase family protein [Spirillospora sp. NPDC127200]
MHRANGDAVDRSITSGSDFLQLNVAEAPPGGLADWLTGRLRAAISGGALPVGARLPATRVLAAELRVSRGVVTEAYQRLAEDGQVEGRGRGGTVVVAAPLAVRPGSAGSDGAGPVGAGSADVDSVRTGPASVRAGLERVGSARPVEELFEAEPGSEVFDALREAPCRIDLTPGVPELAAFPRAAWMRAERAVLAGLPASGFGYGDPRGAPALRAAVADWLARNRGIRASPDEVVIVAGTAQALALLTRVLHADGIGAVAVEDPGSLGVRRHLRDGGMETPPAPVDEQGVRVDALRACGAPAVLLTPAHQFPMGVVLGGERRRELMGWARDGGLVIEDDYDAEHRYDRPPVGALRALLAEHVCYAGSVSKLLAPALRVGWVLVPSRHREALVAAKRYADLGNAALPQLVLAELMRSGRLERHLRMVRGRHRRRRDTMIEAIRAHLPGAVVHGAAAGLHLTVTLDSGPPDRDLAAAALARGVKVQPLSWHRQRPGRPGLVLGYAASAPSEIAEGVAVLGRLLRRRPG